jgi:integrase
LLDEEHRELLEDGKVLLYTRNGIFQARVYRGDRHYISRSLKTRKLEEARRLARRFFYEIEIKREEGLPLQTKTFATVINEYTLLREREYERGKMSNINDSTQEVTSIYMLRQIKRVSKFWLAYCGNKEVEKVDNGVLKDYISWRKEYYHKLPERLRPKNYSINPADKTLEWESTYAKTVLKYAKERGYLGAKSLPDYRYKAERRIVRPAFTIPEYVKLYTRMRMWIKETENESWRYTRELLRDYVLILANSGMRVGEANNLKEGDVVEFKDELGRKNYLFNVKGKTGKRTVIPRANAVRYIERNIRRNQEWTARQAELSLEKKTGTNVQVKTSPNRRKTGSLRTAGLDKSKSIGLWFFRMADGGQVITLIDQFRVLLDSIGLSKSRDGLAYTLYSLRHFYAVEMLRKGRVGVFDIARNMGTSVQIIEQYYGRQATPMALATKLGG